MKQLIEKLASKEYCPCHPEGGKNAILSHPKPIYIGDVLERAHEFLFPDNDSGCSPLLVDLIMKWKRCGLSKSLQQIEEESGYEEIWLPCNGYTGTKNKIGGAERRCLILKSPSARALEAFLTSIL